MVMMSGVKFMTAFSAVVVFSQLIKRVRNGASTAVWDMFFSEEKMRSLFAPGAKMADPRTSSTGDRTGRTFETLMWEMPASPRYTFVIGL